MRASSGGAISIWATCSFEQPDGRLRCADRAKYLIKSGGENIYPTEIERVLMTDKRVAEAVVVRRRDRVWGEVPVAFVALHDPQVTADEIRRVCRACLSSYSFRRTSASFPS